jgi:uncharacterized repeat protein (TIGR01451 family)
MKHFVLTLICFFCLQLAFGQGWVRHYPAVVGDVSSNVGVIEANDGNAVVFGITSWSHPDSINTTFSRVFKIDKKGNLIWDYVLPISSAYIFNSKIIKTDDNGFLLLFTSNNGDTRCNIVKIDSNGRELWRKLFFNRKWSSIVDAKLLRNPDQIVVVGNVSKDASGSDNNAFMIRLNMNGDSLWAKTDFLPNSDYYGISNIGIDNNKRIYLSVNDYRQTGANQLSIWKVDTVGNQLKKIGWNFPQYFKDFKLAKDGNLFLSHNVKIDTGLNIVWRVMDDWETCDYVECFDRRIAHISIDSERVAFSKPHFIFRSSNGQVITQRLLDNRDMYFTSIIQLADSSFLAIGYANDNGKSLVIKLDKEGRLYSNSIIGNIYRDSVANCRRDISEKGLKNWLVVANKNGNNPKYGVADSLGNYNILIDTGNYTIQSYVPNANWRLCTPSVTKAILVKERNDTINFAAQPLFNCPQMRASLTTFGLRRCFESSYNIRYANEGTMSAQNSYITLKLDSLLEYVSATRPLSSRQGQLLRFNLGTVGVNSDGNFSVNVRVRCGDSTRLGQSLCTEARIYPDTFCAPTPNWSGANIVVNGRCDRDSVRFEIRNIGTAQSADLQRVIVEDEIVFLRNRAIYPPNSPRTLSFPANGKTWRLTSEQEPNHPLSNRPTAVVEGCRALPNLQITTGLVNQFSTDDGSPTVDNVCSAIIGAYDPNDKQGLPFGYKSQHFIEQNQDLEYTIRFQNTGTDTAFTVVIRDTLSAFLDIPSIRTGASSHRYTWAIDDKNVLVFRFDNILLPDSFRNKLGSQGFVKFKIKQLKDNALGSVIRNSAAIFFDFNAPIITNQTFHTIGKEFLTVRIEEINKKELSKINVYPNPFSQTTTIELESNTPLSKTLIFKVLDATGRVLRQEKFVGNQLEFDRKGLPAGFYLFTIESDNQIIGNGKIIIQ